MTVFFSGTRPNASFDLEAVEMLVRGAMHRAGAAVLSRLLATARATSNSMSKAFPSRRGCGA